MDPRITPSDDLQQQLRCSHCKRSLQITSSPSNILSCSNCQKVFYCSTAHMKAHSAKHKKSDCFPAIIQSSPKCGRYWVASRDIAVDEIIFTDRATVFAPNVPCVSPLYPTCVGCCRATNTSYRCSRCGWPMCSKRCEKLPVHSMNECKVFRKNKVASNCRPQHYFFIQFLRALLLQEQDPQSFSELMQLESHIKARSQVKEEVFMLKSFYRFLTEECNLLNYDLNVVDHIVGVNRVNCYSADALINGRKRLSTAVFPKLSLINHNCRPNTRTILHEDPRTFTLFMELRACVNISQGEEISQQYITSTRGTLTRQQNLSEDWYFNCVCDRCKDSTEFNTYFSAIKCNNCTDGYLLPRNPLQIDSPWHCGIITDSNHNVETGCGCTKPLQDVKVLIEGLEKELKLAELNTGALEKLLCDLSANCLHPNHYLLINIKFGLLDGIVRKLNYYAAGRSESIFGFVSDDDILKAVELAKSILTVTRAICPGRSYCVGIVLYFLSCCLIEMKTRKINSKFSDAQVECFIKEAYMILHVEADGSSYKEMAKALEARSLEMEMENLSF